MGGLCFSPLSPNPAFSRLALSFWSCLQDSSLLLGSRSVGRVAVEFVRSAQAHLPNMRLKLSALRHLR